jgi:hypothetical protein
MHKIGGLWPRSAWAKKRDPISKLTRAKRAGIMAQVVQYLPGKCEVLNSNPQYLKKIAKNT